MPFAMRRTIRSLLVAVVVSCACGSSQTAAPDSGDAGSDATDTLPDYRLADLDCADCNGFCGDGILRLVEQCDDGNRMSGDGCTQTCAVEAGWTCPTPGSPCQRN